MPAGFDIDRVEIGRDSGQFGLEILVLDAHGTTSVNRKVLFEWHKARVKGRPTPVVVIARKDGRAWIFGPNPDGAVISSLREEQVARMAQTALDQPSGLAARQRFVEIFTALDTTTGGAAEDQMLGVRNSGLFASHELRTGVRARPDWKSACERSEPLLRLRREELIGALGFTSNPLSAHAIVLSSGGINNRAVAILLDDVESFDGESRRLGVSPISYAIALAQKHDLPWVMILRGSVVRLYPARLDLGISRKSPAETFFEIDLSLVADDTAGFLSLICSAAALADGGTTEQILAACAQYAVGLGDRLRGRIYENIVPQLSLSIARQLPELGHPLDRDGLDLAYRLTLRVFFRLLFQAYAEDHKLLPYGENARYDRNALNRLARDLVEEPDAVPDPESASLWDDLRQVWHVIDKGDKSWGVPAYNGGLFAIDEDLYPEGTLLERIIVKNDVMAPVLREMLIDEADGIVGPIDFRSLSVREFGTIYEGLLESNLSVAGTDLMLDASDTWVPVVGDDVIAEERFAAAGTVYFHNTSGQRKGTGSYFTPHFVVEHLLERSLDPVLAEHLERVKALLDAGKDVAAAEQFFDFRVADIAMGSGHFLTAAIDHIEQGMGTFLAEHPIPGVANELRRLEAAAIEALGENAVEIEPMSLLRRQIARRCVYGLDINPIAVELARVSIWIHTFVRGLPMSSLDHNLVCANSLTGIGTLEEASLVLENGRFGGMDATAALEKAKATLIDVANADEATRKDSQASARAVRRAYVEAKEARLRFDAAVLVRTGHADLVHTLMGDIDVARAGSVEAQALIAPLQPAHMPFLFPEVFLRERSGFDVLVGNPPWEKIKVEEHQWWGLRFPGLRAMPMDQRKKRLTGLKSERPDLVAEYEADVKVASWMRGVIGAGPYPGIGSGDIDLYKAFAWRNWQLLAERGRMGVVLPRGALSGSGTEQWRREVLNSGSFYDVVVTVNTGHWVFENVDGRYTTAFVVAERDANGKRHVAFAGPFHSRREFEARRNELFSVGTDEFETWTGTAAFPLIPDATVGEIFRQMRRSPEFSPKRGPRDPKPEGFEFRPAAEIHATGDRALFDTNVQDRSGPIPVFTGAAFNLWNPDAGQPYGWADETAVEAILAKVKNSDRQARSVFNGLGIEDASQLPMRRARIAFRDVTNATNTRTTIACLVPPNVILVHKAPYLVRRQGSAGDEAYVLGVLSSIPFDWYARRLVELTMSFELLNSFPVPRPSAIDTRRLRIVEIAGRLAAKDERFAVWANEVGVPVGSVPSEDVDQVLAELDALVAHLYGLSRKQVEHVFATFHRGWEYQSRLVAVLEHFDALGPVK